MENPFGEGRMMHLIKPIAALAASALALAACGQKTDLEPLANASLPPTPYGNQTPPTAEQLLELKTLAAPERSVELRRRSEEREDDPFDLPPE
jgi:predicted small lipoprotein YifL